MSESAQKLCTISTRDFGLVPSKEEPIFLLTATMHAHGPKAFTDAEGASVCDSTTTGQLAAMMWDAIFRTGVLIALCMIATRSPGFLRTSRNDWYPAFTPCMKNHGGQTLPAFPSGEKTTAD